MNKILKSKGLFFAALILIVLVLILVKELPGCNRPAPKADTVTKVITRTVTIHDTTHSKPVVLYKYITKQQRDTIVMGEGGCEFTVVSADTLQTEYGPVATLDTLQNNTIIGRQWFANLHIPVNETIKTITQQAEPRRQVYFNYGVDGGYNFAPVNNLQWSAGVVAGISYKDRKDRMFTVNGSFNTDNQLRVQLVRSGKISFRK